MASKSEVIRQFFKAKPNATNAEVVADLALKGVDVSANLINQVRHDYKHKKRVEDNDPLLRVKRLAEELGGIDRLIQLAGLLKRLLDNGDEDASTSNYFD